MPYKDFNLRNCKYCRYADLKPSETKFAVTRLQTGEQINFKCKKPGLGAGWAEVDISEMDIYPKPVNHSQRRCYAYKPKDT